MKFGVLYINKIFVIIKSNFKVEDKTNMKKEDFILNNVKEAKESKYDIQINIDFKYCIFSIEKRLF